MISSRSREARIKRDVRDTKLRDGRRKPQRNDHRYDRHDRRDDYRDRRGNDRSQYDDGIRNRDRDHGRRVNLASANFDDRRVPQGNLRSTRNTNFYDSTSDGSASEWASDYGSESGSDYMDVGVEANHPRAHPGQLEPIRPYQSPTSQRNKSVDRRDRSDRREREDHSRERRSYGPCGACGGQGHDAHFSRRRCKFCKQVHDVGRCELFTQFEQLTKFVKNTVDKALVPT